MPVRKILIVDDSPTDRRFLLEALSKAGFQCVTADNGDEAIAKSLLGSDLIDPEAAFIMDRDAAMFHDLLSALQKGSDALKITAARDAETVAKLAELDKAFGEFRTAPASIISNLRDLAGAKQEQARSATEVAGSMQDILRVTQQITDGTKLTATSVGQLATLAKELKGSVSRFRMK